MLPCFAFGGLLEHHCCISHLFCWKLYENIITAYYQKKKSYNTLFKWLQLVLDMLALIDDKIFKIEYLENFKATIEKSDKKETPPKRNYQL